MKDDVTPPQDPSLKDLLDISTFQDLIDSFTRITGISTAILDNTGDILFTSGWQQVCTEFHRKNKLTAQRCRESDTMLARQMSQGKKYVIYKCQNGLVDIAVPIILENTHIGNLFAGQFFIEPPDSVFFIRQAETFGFEKDLYLKAIASVPVFSTRKVKQAIKFLVDLTVIIGNIGIDKKRLNLLNNSLERRIHEQTVHLQTEIQTRKKTEEVLQFSKQFLESVLNAIQDGICVIDREMNILLVNKTMHHWYPHLEESIGKKCYGVYHGRSAPCENCPSLRTLVSNTMEMTEVPIPLADGAVGTLELFAYPLFTTDGEVIGVVEYVRDITKRKEAESRFNKEKAFSESLVDSLPGIMYVFNQRGYLKRWNSNFEQVIGTPSQTMNGKNVIDYIAPEDKTAVLKSIAKVFREGAASVEANVITHAGRFVPHLLTGRRFSQSGIDYLVGVGLNISDRVETEKEKQMLINQLQETLSQVKQLSGLLPICASCKKIRDDAGYWSQIEEYISKRSEAEFSHSLCPDCVKALYPDLDISL